MPTIPGPGDFVLVGAKRSAPKSKNWWQFWNREIDKYLKKRVEETAAERVHSTPKSQLLMFSGSRSSPGTSFWYLLWSEYDVQSCRPSREFGVVKLNQRLPFLFSHINMPIHLSIYPFTPPRKKKIKKGSKKIGLLSKKLARSKRKWTKIIVYYSIVEKNNRGA